jgi:PAS domain S-box-containing protein
MQFFFWVPTFLSLLLLTVLWQVCRKNRDYRRGDTIAHEAQQFKAYFQNDETKAQKTEEKLRGYLNLLDTLINTIPNPIYFKDEDGIYRGCNNAFAKRILGLSRAEIIGRKSQDLTDQIPPELAVCYQRNEHKLRLKGGVQSFEAEVSCSSGMRREFLFSIASVINDDGTDSGSIGVMLDLTEKNRAARDRYQKEKLQGVLETAGAVCHEMNQPLQTILGVTELALADISLNNQAYLPLTKIGKQIDRMAEITRKLQSITRYETMEYDSKTKILDIHKASVGNI